MKYNKLDLPTLKDFRQRCENHDWTFSYSDDNKAYERKRKTELAIDAVVKLGGEDYYKIWRDVAKEKGVFERVSPMREVYYER